MTKFVVGDTIHCIDASAAGLTLNKLYQIKAIDRHDLVEVMCDKGYKEFYFSGRFILTDEENE